MVFGDAFLMVCSGSGSEICSYCGEGAGVVLD